MSIMYCEKHDSRWDSDYLECCPLCENSPEPSADEQAVNQCDGCQRGLPIVNGMHELTGQAGSYDGEKMACTKDRYTHPRAAGKESVAVDYMAGVGAFLERIFRANSPAEASHYLNELRDHHNKSVKETVAQVAVKDETVEVGRTSKTEPVATANPESQVATPLTDALLNKNVNETNDALEIIQESLNDLTVHARDLERRLAYEKEVVQTAHREKKQIKQELLEAIDTIITVSKARELAEQRLSQRPDQQELAKRLNDEYARVKCAAARGDTNIPGINLDLVRAAAAALSKEV